MKLSLILNIAAEYLVILPAMFSCFLPVIKWLKIAPLKLFLTYSAVLILLCLALGCLNVGNGKYYANLFFLPLMLIFIIIYFLSVDLDKRKLLYLFLCVAASLSFAGLAGCIIEAAVYPKANVYKLSDYGLITQYLVSFLFLGIFYLFRNKIVWIFENFHSKVIWGTVWIVPLLILLANVMMEPVEYRNIWVGRIFLLYVTLEVVLLCFFMFFQFMFYQIAKTSQEKYLLEKKALIFQIQANQYEALKNYMVQTRQLRHDFKHVMMTVGELIQKESYAEVKNYAERYYETFSDNGMQYNFCKNTAVNALLSYYANIAAGENIQAKFEVRLPDTIGVSDIDLSILFGNLLEHAITEARAVQSEIKYICLTADTDTPGSLYLVMTNSYEESCQSKEESYEADMASIKAIAEKYHGVAEFYGTNTEFVSNIMLNISIPAK